MICFAFHKYIVIFCHRSGFPGRDSESENSWQMLITEYLRDQHLLKGEHGSKTGQREELGCNATPSMHSWPSGWWEARMSCRDVPSWGEKARILYPMSYSHWMWASLVMGLTLSEGTDLGYLLQLRHQSAKSWGMWKTPLPTAGQQVPLWKGIWVVQLHAHHTFPNKDKEQ